MPPAEVLHAPHVAPDLHYVLIMPVWGEHHTGLFLRYCIPFLLTDGNVGAFPDKELQVHITSKRADFLRMREDSNYRRLAQLTNLVETEIDSIIDTAVSHRAMTECYQLILRSLPYPDNTVTFFPTPDHILSRSALLGLKRRIENGWRGVMMCGVRLALETVGPLLDGVVAVPNGANELSERKLVTLSLRHLHQLSLNCDATSENFMTRWPSHVYWIASDHSWLLAHCFHLHPMAVRGLPRVIDVNTTIDGDYLVDLGNSADQYYVCETSDELCCFELSPSEKSLGSDGGRLTAQHIARFSAIVCNPLHRSFFIRPSLFRGQQNPVIPKRVSDQVAQFCAAVVRSPRVIDRCELLIRGNPALLFLASAVMRAARSMLARNRPPE